MPRIVSLKEQYARDGVYVHYQGKEYNDIGKGRDANDKAVDYGQ